MAQAAASRLIYKGSYFQSDASYIIQKIKKNKTIKTPYENKNFIPCHACVYRYFMSK